MGYRSPTWESQTESDLAILSYFPLKIQHREKSGYELKPVYVY